MNPVVAHLFQCKRKYKFVRQYRKFPSKHNFKREFLRPRRHRQKLSAPVYRRQTFSCVAVQIKTQKSLEATCLQQQP